MNATLTSLKKMDPKWLFKEKRLNALSEKIVEMCVCSGMKNTMDYNVVIVLDPAIYAKILDIVSKLPAQSQEVVLRVWAFHVACTFLAVIGSHWETSKNYVT